MENDLFENLLYLTAKGGKVKKMRDIPDIRHKLSSVRETICTICTDWQKSVNRPERLLRRPEVRVEVSEFISDGGGGEDLPVE